MFLSRGSKQYLGARELNRARLNSDPSKSWIRGLQIPCVRLSLGRLCPSGQWPSLESLQVLLPWRLRTGAEGLCMFCWPSMQTSGSWHYISLTSSSGSDWTSAVILLDFVLPLPACTLMDSPALRVASENPSSSCLNRAFPSKPNSSELLLFI